MKRQLVFKVKQKVQVSILTIKLNNEKKYSTIPDVSGMVRSLIKHLLLRGEKSDFFFFFAFSVKFDYFFISSFHTILSQPVNPSEVC